MESKRTKRTIKCVHVLDEMLMFEVEFRIKRVVKKYECNAGKSVLSLMVLTFVKKYTFDLKECPRKMERHAFSDKNAPTKRNQTPTLFIPFRIPYISEEKFGIEQFVEIERQVSVGVRSK